MAPRPADSKVEAQIKILRESVLPVIKTIKHVKRTYNHTKTDNVALLDLVKSSKSTNISVLPTDKTGKFCLLPHTLVSQKLDEHMKPEDFERLDGDPSALYEKLANELLSDCLVHAKADKHICDK